MKRRDFVALAAGTAALSAMGWPLAARAQQPARMRRIGVLTALAPDDPESMPRLVTFLQALQELGWTADRNLHVDYRFGSGNTDRFRQYATELVALAPDAILATSGLLMMPLLQTTRTVPIVFTQTTDPVGAGYVASLARPGGNATGFTVFEYGASTKWLELLKQIAPRVTRVAVIRNVTLAGGAQFGAIQAVAPSLGTQLRPIDPSDAGELERAVADFAREPNGGLIVTGSVLAQFRRELIISLAARHRLPTVYSARMFVTGGGLVSYGVDTVDQYRRAAGYVDRILRGEKPADLPVQAPTKYETVLNLKTAKALDLEVPPQVLVRADEVIE